jgi:hypothetical protein
MLFLDIRREVPSEPRHEEPRTKTEILLRRGHWRSGGVEE